MKRIGFVLLTVGMVVGLGSCSGGGDGSKSSCSDAFFCARTGQTLQICCSATTTTQCELRTGGEIFQCNKDNCTDAMPKAVTYCGG